jgi:STE24 endopeptidase
VTARTWVWIAIGAIAGAAWLVAAVWLLKTSVPDLSLPGIDPSDYWSEHEVDRAETFELVLSIIYLLGTVAVVAALFFAAVWAPGFARNTGLGPVGAGVIVGMITLVIVWAVNVPFGIAEQWWSRRYDITDESYLSWLFTPWPELASAAVLGLFLIAVTMALARWLGRFWWVVGAPVFIALATFFAFVYPYLDPYEQKPISAAPQIAQRLPEIEERTGAGPTDVHIAVVSDTTSLVNGYTAGFGPSERVVIWDTLLDGRFSDDQVLVVLAHELGHVASSHILKSLAWYALFAFPLALAVAELTRRRGGMGEPGNVPLAALILVILSFGLAPLDNAITRRYEAEADWIALTATHDPDAARQLFVDFVASDLADPSPSWWQQQIFGSHPSVADRIAMTQAWAERNR